MEFLSGGSLDGFLHELKDEGQEMSPLQLFQIVFGIVRGMAHLAGSRVVHRDLAARNILLDGDHVQPRISDFGFSRVVGDDGEGKTNATGALFPQWR
jgi:serine/threonine protein kinase